MYVYKSRHGVYYGRVEVGGREIRRSLRTTNRAKAQQRLKKIEEDIEHAQFYGEERHTWKAAVGRWAMEAQGAISPGTFKRYTVSLGQVEHTLGEKYLDEIDCKAVAQIGGRKDVTNATKRRDLTAVSSVLRYCVNWGWLEANVVSAYDRSVIKERLDPIVLPHAEDIDAVVSLCPGNFAKMVRLAQYTGMREEEIGSLERRQVRLTDQAIDLWKTKTNRPRTVDLDPRAVGTLSGTPRQLRKPWIFWHHEGQRYENISSRFAAITARAIEKGFTETRFRFHDLRHWYAVDYLRRRGNIYDLQKQLGHDSITTTEGYLRHLTPEQARNAKFDQKAQPGSLSGTPITVSEE